MIPSSPPLLAAGFHAVPEGHLAAIVTALDMKAKPPAPPRKLPTGFSLERQVNPSIAWYRDLFRRIGAPWLWTSRLRMNDEALASVLSAPASEIYLLRDGAGAHGAGLLELDFSQEGQCEIAFFGLMEAYRHRGLGKAMMAFALETAWARTGIERVWIHTCTLDDPAALPFYRSFGFAPYARQVEILPDPRLAGLLPREMAPAHPLL